MNGCTSLAHLEPGRSARLCDHERPDSLPRRLSDLGFVPGTQLTVLRRAPLGDPIEVELRGYRICLRRADVDGVCLVPEPERP